MDTVHADDPQDPKPPFTLTAASQRTLDQAQTALVIALARAVWRYGVIIANLEHPVFDTAISEALDPGTAIIAPRQGVDFRIVGRYAEGEWRFFSFDIRPVPSPIRVELGFDSPKAGMLKVIPGDLPVYARPAIMVVNP